MPLFTHGVTVTGGWVIGGWVTGAGVTGDGVGPPVESIGGWVIGAGVIGAGVIGDGVGPPVESTGGWVIGAGVIGAGVIGAGVTGAGVGCVPAGTHWTEGARTNARVAGKKMGVLGLGLGFDVALSTLECYSLFCSRPKKD